MGVEQCFYCGALVNRRAAARGDHFPFPKHVGGTMVVPCCESCHDMKDRFNLDSWPIEWVSEVTKNWSVMSRETRIFLAKVFAVFSSVKHQEITQKESKTKEALERTKAGGRKTGGDVPFGWNAGPDKVLIPNPKEQQTMWLAVELREDGRSFRAIATELNRAGLTTKRGVKWSGTQVRRIIKSRYTGSVGRHLRMGAGEDAAHRPGIPRVSGLSRGPGAG